MIARNNILQIGFGNFGSTHLQAWRSLGLAENLFVVDPAPAARAACINLGIPSDHVGCDASVFLDSVRLVDVLVPTDLHYQVCKPLFEAGKDLFIEKPMTTVFKEAEHLSLLARRHGNIVQIGFYFRFHPLTQIVKAEIDEGRLGDIRYISGRFHGFKRARGDSGVVQNDAVHFIDQSNWLLGELPAEVNAITRDHFERGYDDLGLIHLFYPSGAVANIEVGCIQPGCWNDDIVPGSTQTKKFMVAGSEGAAEIDYQTFEVRLNRVRHEIIDRLWQPVNEGSEIPYVVRVEPWQIVAAELRGFLSAAETRTQTVAPMEECGVGMTRILEAIEKSSRSKRRVPL